jgi:hypothetical protein
MFASGVRAVTSHSQAANTVKNAKGASSALRPLPAWPPAGGVGLRWRLTRQNRLNFRIDYALGRDDDSLIISVGDAF